jgi:hypothetical protein
VSAVSELGAAVNAFPNRLFLDLDLPAQLSVNRTVNKLIKKVSQALKDEAEKIVAAKGSNEQSDAEELKRNASFLKGKVREAINDFFDLRE